MRAHALHLTIGCLIISSEAFQILLPKANKNPIPWLAASKNGDSPDAGRISSFSQDRRHLLLSTLSLSLLPWKTNARGLVQFPVDDPSDLLNTYHFLRVGTTLLEEEDIWSTNPLFLYVGNFIFLKRNVMYSHIFVFDYIMFIPEPIGRLH